VPVSHPLKGRENRGPDTDFPTDRPEQMRHKAAMFADSILSPPALSLAAARATLERVWGHADFRGRQAEVVTEILAGRDVVAVLPTGGGKSVCYQIPAMLRPGLGLVVSPLIALMTDQVEALKQQGVAAARLDSGVSMDDRSAIWRQARAGSWTCFMSHPRDWPSRI